MIKESLFRQKMKGLASAVQELIAEAKEIETAALNEEGDMEGEDAAIPAAVSAAVAKATKTLAKARQDFSAAGAD